MLKFIKGHADSIVGIEIYPIIAFLIFFLFFLVLLVYVILMNKKELDELSALPLDHDQTITQEKL